MLNTEHKAGPAGTSDMPRAVIMSGLTQNELHLLVRSYREDGLVRQHWATLTPHSEGWTLESLLKELQAEHEAMKNKRKS